MNIWRHDEIPGYNRTKANTVWSRWRILVIERLGELGVKNSVERLNSEGLQRLGLDYDYGLTAEEVAQRLAE